jgi:adenylosuccinate lyase
MDFKYVFAGLRKLNRTFDVHQSERSCDIADTAAVLNCVACRLPVEPRNKNLARALHKIAAQLVSVSKLDHELDVPAAADLIHRIRYAGMRYD